MAVNQQKTDKILSQVDDLLEKLRLLKEAIAVEQIKGGVLVNDKYPR